MSYTKAEHILPTEIIKLIQNYVDGECIYIPRKLSNKKEWGTNTSIRAELSLRNKQIFRDYKNGYSLGQLSQKYYLSLKSIQRIIKQEKTNAL